MSSFFDVCHDNTYQKGFNKAGITCDGGHGAMISTVWLGEYLYSDSRAGNGQDSVATGIELFGNDHYIDNTIVFSSKIGVKVTHPASILRGVHTWNLATSLGGTGIFLDSGASQIRLIGCYLDFNDLVLVSPLDVSVFETFLIGGGTVVLRANKTKDKIEGLTISDSQYHGAGTKGIPTITLDESGGNKFVSVINMLVKGTMIQEKAFVVKSNAASKSLSLVDSTQWFFNFSDVLLFDGDTIGIQWVEYTFVLDNNDGTNGAIVKHMARQPVGLTVTVESNVACNATVYMKVDQSIQTL